LYRYSGPSKARFGTLPGFLASCLMTGPAIAVTLPSPPAPEEGNTFNLFVADQFAYDDNLFRVAPNITDVTTTFAPNASKDDYINSTTAGANGQWFLGRQAVDLNLHVDENRFARNKDLNNTSGDGKLVWDWRLGGYFSGQAGATYDRSLASFSETRYLGRDMVADASYFGSARYQVGPRWAVVGGVRDSDTKHGAVPAQFDNFHSKTGNAGIEYATDVNDTFLLEYTYFDGRFPNNIIVGGAPFASDYHENLVRFTVNYAPSEKTSFNAKIAHLTRDYNEVAFGKFSGILWRVSMDWRPTDKTELVAQTWHEIHAYSVSAADYFLSKGGSLGPVWNPREKLALSVVVSLEDQSYITSSTSALTLGSRDDKLTGEQLNIAYKPRSAWLLNFFVRNEQRRSNQSQFRYNDKLANVSVSYKFW